MSADTPQLDAEEKKRRLSLQLDVNSCRFHEFSRELRFDWYNQVESVVKGTLRFGKRTWLDSIYAVVDDEIGAGLLFLVQTNIGPLRVRISERQIKARFDGSSALRENLERTYKAERLLRKT